MACAARLSFIVGLHGEVRRGANLGLEGFILTVATRALLAFFHMCVVIERHLPGAQVPPLILGLLLEGEGRWDLGLWLGKATRRREAYEQEARENKHRALSDN